MKRIFIICASMMLCVVLCLPCSAALNWNDISSYRYSYSGDEGLVSAKQQIMDELSDDLTEYMMKNPITVYIRLVMCFQYSESEAPIYPLIANRKKVSLKSDSVTDKKVYDVTGMLDFGFEDSKKPTAVYIGDTYTDTWICTCSPKEGKTLDEFWGTTGWTSAFNYRLDMQKCDVSYEIILRYDFQTQGQPVKANDFRLFNFTDNVNLIDFTPVIAGSPFVGNCIIVPYNIFVLNKSVPNYVPREGVEQNPYYTITSTNIFSPFMAVSDSYFYFDTGTKAIGYKPYENFSFSHEYMFYRTNNTRVGINKTIDKMPYLDTVSPDDGVYVVNSFQFDDIQSTYYGCEIDASKFRFGRQRDGASPSASGYMAGYAYKVNTRLSNNMLNGKACNAFRFSVNSYTSYDEIYYSEIVTNNDIDYQGVNIQDFYKEVQINFSTEEGVVKGLSQFFADLFTVTLPAIINNFVVWFMCEAPLISTITKPAFLICHLTVGYTVSWIVPIITSCGIFGVVFFIIFIIKRLLPYIGGSRD